MSDKQLRNAYQALSQEVPAPALDATILAAAHAAAGPSIEESLGSGRKAAFALAACTVLGISFVLTLPTSQPMPNESATEMASAPATKPASAKPTGGFADQSINKNTASATTQASSNTPSNPLSNPPRSNSNTATIATGSKTAPKPHIVADEIVQAPGAMEPEQEVDVAIAGTVSTKESKKRLGERNRSLAANEAENNARQQWDSELSVAPQAKRLSEPSADSPAENERIIAYGQRLGNSADTQPVLAPAALPAPAPVMGKDKAVAITEQQAETVMFDNEVMLGESSTEEDTDRADIATPPLPRDTKIVGTEYRRDAEAKLTIAEQLPRQEVERQVREQAKQAQVGTEVLTKATGVLRHFVAGSGDQGPPAGGWQAYSVTDEQRLRLNRINALRSAEKEQASLNQNAKKKSDEGFRPSILALGEFMRDEPKFLLPHWLHEVDWKLTRDELEYISNKRRQQ